MNIFRLIGDFSHIAAILILLLKIWKTRSCSGVSGKTQIMFALCFITRYLGPGLDPKRNILASIELQTLGQS